MESLVRGRKKVRKLRERGEGGGEKRVRKREDKGEREKWVRGETPERTRRRGEGKK